MSTPNNPAGRLHLILDRAKSLAETTIGQPSISVWPQVLLCASDTPRDLLFARIARVQELPNTVNIQMHKVPDLEAIDDYLCWVADLTSSLSRNNFDEPLQQFTGTANEANMAWIRQCDRVLQQHFPEPTLTKQELQALRNAAQQLVSDINHSSLDEQLKEYMLYHLDLVNRAIDDYHVVGIESFVRTTESIIGAAIYRSDQTQEATESQFGERFKQVVGTCFSFAGKYATLRPLLLDAVKLLSEGKNLLP